MATEVFKKEEITLISGRELLLKPISIKQTRLFQRELKNYYKAVEESTSDGRLDNDAEFLDNFLALVKICLMKDYAEFAADDDALEEELDVDSIFKILEVCGGMRFNDPNLQVAALMASSTME